MTKPVLYEWALDQTTLPPTTQAQWEEGFTYLNAATNGKVPTYVHDYPFSEITKAIRWTLDAIPDDGVASAYVENRFKGNQIPVVEGKDGHPLPSATPTTYPAGDEIAAGIIAFTTVVNLTYVAGVYSADSGIMRRLYTKDSAGLITKSSQYGGIKLTDGSQLQALVDDIANGSRITEVGNDVAVDGDFAVTDFRFIGLSDERGAWADINDIESFTTNLEVLAEDLAGFPNGTNLSWTPSVYEFKEIITVGFSSGVLLSSALPPRVWLAYNVGAAAWIDSERAFVAVTSENGCQVNVSSGATASIIGVYGRR
ncbi:tail protein [Vibrio phage 13VT501A]|nr:tail protein [Vibrio phage 13VT501A]